MNYRKISKTDLNVSTIALGTWAMGNDFWGDVDDKDSISAIQASLDSGINFIDTAPAYGAGHAETVVAKAIQGKRDKVVLATKTGVVRTKTEFLRDLNPATIQKDMEESLKRLNTDYIDLYYIHWPDVDTPLEDSVNTLIKLKEQGKFRYLAVSNFTVELMDQIQTMTDVVCLQPNYSLLNRKIEKELVPYCVDNELSLITYGTLAGGILTGKHRELPEFGEADARNRFYNFYRQDIWQELQGLLTLLDQLAEKHDCTVGQISIAWASQQKGVTSVLVGAKNSKQVQANAKAATVSLDETDFRSLQTYIAENLQNVVF